MIIGIDPHSAKPFGFAVVHNDGIIMYGLGDIHVIAKLINTFKFSFVAVEDQYMARNYKVAKALSWSAGKIMGIAELAGIPVEIVNVATWKSKMNATKGRHIQVMREMYNMDVPDDEASACLISLYANKFLRSKYE